jgi:hypothetical protein
MMQSILRVVLTTLALVLLFAGSLNLNRTSAQEVIEGGGGGTCSTYCPCQGGPLVCCQVVLPDGTQIVCGMKDGEHN